MTIAEMVEALLLFDEPMLNSRYHGLMSRYAHGPMRDELRDLPAKVLASSRLARAAAEHWMRGEAHLLDAEFIEWGERTLLDSFLSLAESQTRLLSYAARAAPTQAIRDEFNDVIEAHREIATTLREALSLLSHKGLPKTAPQGGLRGVQEEETPGGLRAQLEATIRASNDSGHAIRHVILSHTGLRHLRDQGWFTGGDATILGIPVIVDMGWDAPAFALSTFDAIPLEEILRGDAVAAADRGSAAPASQLS